MRSASATPHLHADAPDRATVAAYVASLSADLALMARRHGLDTLGYILEMARLEAENEVKTSADAQPVHQRR